MIKIGLALGGGGARGAAHIGVLEELEALGIEADLLAGTSIGAAVAAMTAAGLSPKDVQDFFERFSLPSVFKFQSKQPAISDNRKLTQLLESFIGRPTFAELKKPLMVVATNFVAKNEVVITEGDVVSAVIASMSIPVLLPPVQRNGLTLVDGGLVNNTPFDVVRAHGATFTIGVDLGNGAPYGSEPQEKPTSGLLGRAVHYTKKQPILQVLTTMADMVTAQSVKTRLAIAPPDILLQPAMGTINLLDFQNLSYGIQAGRDVVRQHQQQLMSIGTAVQALPAPRNKK